MQYNKKSSIFSSKYGVSDSLLSASPAVLRAKSELRTFATKAESIMLGIWFKTTRWNNCNKLRRPRCAETFNSCACVRMPDLCPRGFGFCLSANWVSRPGDKSISYHPAVHYGPLDGMDGVRVPAIRLRWDTPWPPSPTFPTEIPYSTRIPSPARHWSK